MKVLALLELPPLLAASSELFLFRIFSNALYGTNFDDDFFAGLMNQLLFF